MNLKKLKSVLLNEPGYRFKQIYQLIFKNFITDWEQALSLPKNLREQLEIQCDIGINSQIFTSKDKKTLKALIELSDNNKVEAVLMRYSDIHNTVCVSSQVGCSMGCDFCATGKMGLKRNLSADEIIMQILVFARILNNENCKISNIVFMGMGEPLLNYENVISAIYEINNKDIFNISARKISISTCGIIPGIEKLMNEPLQLNLAVSLHAPNDKLRSMIMPVNKRFGLEKTLLAVRKYIEKTNRKVMIEYILLKGINDSSSHADELANILKKYLKNLFMVNLIVYNSITAKYKAPETKEITKFKSILESHGLTVTQRFRFGHDVKGACGQLATGNSTNHPKLQ